MPIGTPRHAARPTARPGGAITLAGERGAALEAALGPSAAGALIYAVSRPHLPVPDFHDTNEGALANLRRGAAA
jgi:hypothetical protein